MGKFVDIVNFVPYTFFCIGLIKSLIDNETLK